MDFKDWLTFNKFFKNSALFRNMRMVSFLLSDKFHKGGDLLNLIDRSSKDLTESVVLNCFT